MLRSWNLNKSITISLFVHLILLILFAFIKYNIDYPIQDYIEIGFGNSGTMSSAGAIGTQLQEVEKNMTNQELQQSKQASIEEKEIKLPEVKNVNPEETPISTPKNKDKDISSTSNNKNLEKESKTSSESIGNKTAGDGSFGFDIDWGGRGARRIYSYSLPEYPGGVQKEIDIKLRFSILPDGTVGNIFLLTKADTRLEEAAVNSLRQWRFEPIPKTQKQIEQIAIIVFPYRLQ